MKVCQKINCTNICIPRGKYCEYHRSSKKKLIKEEEKLNYKEEVKEIENAIKLSLDTYESENKIEEKKLMDERKLKEEQNKEYNYYKELDQKNFEEKELENIIKLSLDDYYNEKKVQKENIKDKHYYKVKIKLPNNFIIEYFTIDAKINDIFDRIDLFIYENKLNIKQYNLILNYPKRIYTKDDINIYLNTLDIEKNFIIYVQDLDS